MARHKLMSLLLIYFTLLGCSRMVYSNPSIPVEITTTPPTLSTSEVSYQDNLDLVLDKECILFQWKNLIPYETTATQTVWLLERNPAILEFDPYEVKEQDQTWIAEINGFYRLSLQPSQELGFAIVFSEPPETNVIDSIIIDLENPIRLGDIIEQCGAPSHISVNMSYGVENSEVYWQVFLFWQELGLMVSTLGTGNPPTKIDSSLLFNDYLEMTSSSEKVIQQGSREFVSWQGHQDFDYYRIDVE